MKPASSCFMAAFSPVIEPQTVASDTLSSEHDTFCSARGTLSEASVASSEAHDVFCFASDALERDERRFE